MSLERDDRPELTPAERRILRSQLRVAYADRPAELAAAWRERVARWSFEDVNELIRQHNEWYPVERQLPMDPRTGDYVLIAGRPYRRDELDVAWALRRFPPEP